MEKKFFFARFRFWIHSIAYLLILKIAVAAKRKENNDSIGFPYSGSVFLLEEPESNPGTLLYQSKLAELIFLIAAKHF